MFIKRASLLIDARLCFLLEIEEGTIVMNDSLPMTREAYKRLMDEIERLEKEELPPILERIANARAEGDRQSQRDSFRRKDSCKKVTGQSNDYLPACRSWRRRLR